MVHSRKRGRSALGRKTAGLAVALMCSVGLAPAAHAQDAAVDQYRAVLQQTADLGTRADQLEYYVAQQEAEIARLQEALSAARSGEQPELLAMLRTMVSQLEEVMVADLPINVERRFALLDDLRADIQAEGASAYDGYRRAFDLISDEVELGLSIDSYSGNNPVSPGQRFAACQQDPMAPRCDLSKDQVAALDRGATVDDFNQLGQLPDGNYINYGRLALLYLERDSSEGYRYDAAAKAWVPLPNSELLTLRQNVRIARGESAIATMTFPVQVGATGADDAS